MKWESMMRHAHCMKCFATALKTDPSNADVLCNKGASLHKLGKYIEALKCFDVTLKIDAKNTVSWINKGIVLLSGSLTRPLVIMRSRFCIWITVKNKL